MRRLSTAVLLAVAAVAGLLILARAAAFFESLQYPRTAMVKSGSTAWAPPSGSTPFQPGGDEDRAGDEAAQAGVVRLSRAEAAALLKNPVPASAASVQAGAQSFQTYCLPCHGEHGQGHGPATAKLAIPPPILPKITSKRTDGYLFATIQNGGMVMPSLAHRLSARATWDVVNYLRSIEESAPKQAGVSPGAGAVSFQADAPPGAAGQPPPAQRASVVRGDAGRGKQVFEENCSLCHDPTSDQAGIGPGLKGLFQWPPHKLSDGTEHAKHTVELIRKQVTQGGGQMEAVGANFSEQQLMDLLAYLQTL